jgi:hypothetical protein
MLFILSALVSRAEGGDGRFNKAYCLKGGVWGPPSFWESLSHNHTYRVAQLSTSNTSGVFFLEVDAATGKFSLSAAARNLTLDLGCQPRSLPSYSGVSFGSYPSGVWARGPIGDANKVPRCWWVRCNLDESRADTCGSEGEAPCARLDATFLRYAAPGPEVPPLDSACYPISLDSQVDPTHRVDWKVQFVDGLWPPHPHFRL